jgi:tungstate transport system substrate-binding protein
VGRFPDDQHYLSAGLGQGDVLAATSQMHAYMLVDRGTYTAFRSRVALDILVDGDPRMLNPYGVIAVNPARNPGVNYKAALRFIDWITGAEGKRAITEYRVGGEQLFFPADR